MTVEEMLNRMSSTELTWWAQLFKIKAAEQEEQTKSSSGKTTMGGGDTFG
jgi:hypothetical protein